MIAYKLQHKYTKQFLRTPVHHHCGIFDNEGTEWTKEKITTLKETILPRDMYEVIAVGEQCPIIDNVY